MTAEARPDGLEFVGTNVQDLPEFRYTRDDSVVVRTPSGRFLMGTTLEEARLEYQRSGLAGAALEDWFLAEAPRVERSVGTLLADKYAVTNRQFERFAAESGYLTEAERTGLGWRWDIRTQKWKRAEGWSWRRPAGDKAGFPAGPDFPVVQVTWEDASAYCRWAGKRLPTEAEWEYLCRAGTQTRYYWGNDPSYEDIDLHAWYVRNSGGRTHPVGQKGPNGWGLHDMSGNVWEWVADPYGSYSLAPPGPEEPGGSRRVLRGGAWYFHPSYLRSAYRGAAIKGNFVGFRCVMDVPVVGSLGRAFQSG